MYKPYHLTAYKQNTNNMPAYSFQQRFVNWVLDGSKSHTIRARRKKGFAKVGDMLYLYFGMRTKWCRKLRQEVCTNVRTIIITQNNIYLLPDRVTDLQVQQLQDSLKAHKKPYSGILLDDTLRNALAWADGFRPPGSTRKRPGEAFELMIRFWSATHALPFIGDLIDWKPTPAGLAAAGKPKPAK